MSGITKAAVALIVAGACGSANAQTCVGQWLPGSAGFDREIRALASYQGELVCAGDFRAVPGMAVKNVARWNGGMWSGMNADRFDVPRALGVWGGSLFLGGAFRTNASPATGVARWNGAGWEALPHALPTMSAFSFVDTFGEYQGKLVAAGSLRVASPSNEAAMLWDGVNWQSAGAVLSGNAIVEATAVYLGDLYIAGPTGWLSSDLLSGSVLRYDGTTWSKVGPNGLRGGNGGPIALCVHAGKLYIASASVQSAGAFQYGPLVSWDGSTVTTVGSAGALSKAITSMIEYHGDLIIGGAFTDAFGVGASGVVRWDGTNFSALGQGIVGTSSTGRRVNCLSVFQDELIAGGDFATAGGQASPYFARWTDHPTPWVAASPESKPVNQGLTLTLSAAAASGYENVSYQWKRNGAAISDGPGGASAGGGTVSGASGVLASPSDGSPLILTISNVQASDAGEYTVAFSNTCNTATSEIASISVNTCPGDLNADGLVNDADFAIFASAYDLLLCGAPTMPIGCLSDWNGDGVVDDADFQVFVVAYGQMVCE